jgi:hypothetical protein
VLKFTPSVDFRVRFAYLTPFLNRVALTPETLAPGFGSFNAAFTVTAPPGKSSADGDSVAVVIVNAELAGWTGELVDAAADRPAVSLALTVAL